MGKLDEFGKMLIFKRDTIIRTWANLNQRLEFQEVGFEKAKFGSRRSCDRKGNFTFRARSGDRNERNNRVRFSGDIFGTFLELGKVIEKVKWIVFWPIWIGFNELENVVHRSHSHDSIFSESKPCIV
jgi:hypothetical protein